MKKLNLHLKIFIFISAILISSKDIHSQWAIAGDLPGVAGPRPQVSVVDGNTVFVAGGTTPTNATYKTTNGGTNWVQLNTGTLRPFWSIYAKDANTVFAGDNGSGGRINFYKTIDGGNNWTLIDSISGTTAVNAGFRGIRFSNSIPSFGIAYAEGNNGDVYIYKTRDGGNTWTRTVLPGYTGYGITVGLNVIDSLFYAFGTFAAMTGLPPSIIITTDGGVTWNLRNLSLPSGNNNTVRGLAFKDKLNGIAGSSSSSSMIARTTNGGLNWVNINIGYNVTSIFIGPIMRWIEGTDICYLTAMNSSIGGVIKGILKSTNGGLNWAPMETSGLGIIYMDTKRIGSNIYGYANSAAPASGGNVVLKLTDYIITQPILYGDSITLGNGVVRTFVRVNALGQREQIGVSMTEGVMNNLPDTLIHEFVLALPTPVAADDTTFNHLFLTWNPDGHGPPGINEVPHFDFHFSTVSVAERQSVIPGIDPVYYPREFVPKDYLRDAPGVVPNRGLHWGDSTSMQTNQNFKTQFIFTTYRGKRFSWAPGITRAFLLTNPDTLITIKQAQLYRRAGRYPQNYSITHDPINHTYDIVLRTFERREGTPTNPFIGISNGRLNGDSLIAPGCNSTITGGDSVSVDFDLTASDWDVGDSVTLTASFDTPTGGSIVIFTPSLPVKGNPARAHLHFVSNGEFIGRLTIRATDRAGNITECFINFDFPLPVELSSFVSTIHENDVTLNWTTATEDNNARFEIERRDERGEAQDVWNKIGSVQGNGTSSSQQNYTYEDRNLSSGRYKYRLKQIDYNGNFKYYDLQNEVEIGVPTRFELSQNYPNPFNPSTVISYQLPISSFTSLKVYDALGKEVETLVNQLLNAGYYKVDFGGRNFASGQYFYKLQAGNFSQVKRMILLK